MGFGETNMPPEARLNHTEMRTKPRDFTRPASSQRQNTTEKLQLASECTREHPILPGGMKRFNKLWRNVSGRESENKLHRQADLSYAQGKHREAEQFYKDALADYEKEPKPDPLKMAMARNGLANIYYEQKRYKDAEDLYNVVLPIYEQHLDPDEYRTEGVRRKLADIAEKLEHFGNYRRGEHLGQGGFANVYRGEHKHLPDQQVAIKKLHTCLVNPENVEEFRKEAKILAKLDHPNIMRVKDYGVKNGFPYLILEYASHGTLRSKHPDGTCLPPTQVAAYVNQIADALDYLHNTKVKIKDEDEEKPLMHLDLKPENLLLGAKGQILLSDFGLAQTVERTTAQLTQEKIAGTLAYMAPEQIAGKPRPASDQYALGIMVYEWLSGKRPFQGKRQREIIAQHLNDDPPPLRGKITGISREMEKNMEQVVFKALEKDPKKRFESVKDFAKALEQACRNCSPSEERGKQVLQEKRPVAQEAQKIDQGNKGKEKGVEKKLQKVDAGSPSTGWEEAVRRVEREVLDHVEKSGKEWLESETGKRYIKENVKYVVPILTNEKIDVVKRVWIANAIGETGDKSAAKDLVPILANEQLHNNLRCVVGELIGKLKDKTVSKDLTPILIHEGVKNKAWLIRFLSERFLPSVIIDTLVELKDSSVVNDLAKMLPCEEINTALRGWIAKDVIGRLADETIIPDLEKIRSDKRIQQYLHNKIGETITILRNKAKQAK